MKDRYLFKAKRIDNGEWKIGTLIILPDGKHEIVNGYAERGRKDRYGGRMYWLTRKGLDWLGEKLGIKIYNEED